MILFLIIFNLCFSQVEFNSPQNLGEIDNDKLSEISGIIPGMKNDNIFWVHNDSGGENVIFAFDRSGVDFAKISLEGSSNIDWEDIAAGYIEDDPYIFVGDIGDNEGIRDSIFIYYFIEPELNLDDSVSIKPKRLALSYPDSPQDSEILLFDNIEKSLLIVSKRKNNNDIYELKYPFEENTLTKIATINLGDNNNQLRWLTGGDISLDGSEILIKNYSEVYYWMRSDDEKLSETFNRTPLKIEEYRPLMEVQGEAICWDREGIDFYTVSEERLGVESKLLYFERKTGLVIVFF